MVFGIAVSRKKSRNGTIQRLTHLLDIEFGAGRYICGEEAEGPVAKKDLYNERLEGLRVCNGERLVLQVPPDCYKEASESVGSRGVQSENVTSWKVC